MYCDDLAICFIPSLFLKIQVPDLPIRDPQQGTYEKLEATIILFLIVECVTPGCQCQEMVLYRMLDQSRF